MEKMTEKFQPYFEAHGRFDASFNGFDSTLYTSPATGHKKFEPMPSADVLDSYYNGGFSDGGNEIYNLEAQFNPGVKDVAEGILAHMQKFAKFGKSFTAHDFGCAFGNLVYAFQNMGITATGNEPNKAWVEAGNKYCKGSLTHEPLDVALAKIPYSIDLFTSFHVFEHLVDPQWAFRAMKERLSPEGIVYVTVPNGASLKILTAGLVDPHIYNFPMHLQYFTPKSIVKHIRDAGLEPFYVSTNWLPHFLDPDEGVFESLFGEKAGDLVAPKAMRKALCSNLLGGELFVLAGHPNNTTAKRMKTLDLRVEKAHQFALRKAKERDERKARLPKPVKPGPLKLKLLGFAAIVRAVRRTFAEGGLRAVISKVMAAYSRT
jgi:SAM-dependent methyltransferase